MVNGVVKASAVCSLQNSNIRFTALSITESISTITVKFVTVGAMYSGNAVLTFTYYDPSTSQQITSLINYVSVNFSNAVMQCSLTSTSNIVGATTTYTFSYTPLVPITAGSILQLNIDPWGAYK